MARTKSAATRPLLQVPGAAGEGSIDSIDWRTWLVQVFCFALASVMLFITLVTASLPQIGYPCFYGTLVDYSVPNNSIVDGVWMHRITGGVAPALFLESATTAAFLYYTAIVTMAVAVYLVIAAFVARSGIQTGGSSFVRGSHTRITALLASHLTITLGTLSAWLLQVVVLLLSHRQIVLAAAAYIAHFLALAFFCLCFCGLGATSVQRADDVRALKTTSSAMHRVAGPWRAVVANLITGALGIAIAILSLMVEMILANSFHISLWQTVGVAVGVFAVVGILFLALAELVVSHYVHVLVGPAFAILVAASALAVAAHNYFARFHNMVVVQAPSIALASRAVMGAVAVVAVAMLVLRVVRACLFHRRKNTAFYGRMQNARSKAVRYVNQARGRRAPLRSEGAAGSRDALLSDAYETDDEPIYDSVAEDRYPVRGVFAEDGPDGYHPEHTRREYYNY
ncbi:envelope glycoprotein M [Equid alphaherpesvirus 3]|uniref:Envelope glycoprotein M n=1 Tax=Equid alphaherpesvirus 3 TaxID=80341 RepID=A0A077B7M4_9ALPH|nr:envelope glycoprotein M [Equid alphaherpesvirus 3]AIL02969.1 envelope glycoprotein M [Equid alphaherpesvirus 3]